MWIDLWILGIRWGESIDAIVMAVGDFEKG